MLPGALSHIRRERMAYSAASLCPEAVMAASSLRSLQKATSAGTAAKHCKMELKKHVFPKL